MHLIDIGKTLLRGVKIVMRYSMKSGPLIHTMM